MFYKRLMVEKNFSCLQCTELFKFSSWRKMSRTWFRQFLGRFRNVLQGVVQLQFIPLEAPHLVEGEHVHALHVA